MNALDSINLSIEFVKQTVDPGGGGEVVNAQTGDIAIWAILAILFVGVIAYCMFRFSRVFNSEFASVTASAKHAKNAHRGARLATTKAGLIFAIIGLITCLSMTATNAIAASNKTNANNVDIQPDKIQVTVDEAAGTINDATFNFVNNSQNYYLFDKTTKMELTSEVEGLTVPEDWDLQLTTLNTDLYNGAPNGKEYTVPADVVTLYPGQSAQATLKFNKGSADIAKTLIGKQVFSLTMIPDQNVIAVPKANTGLVYDGTLITGVNDGTGYVLSGAYQATEAGPYTAVATPTGLYKWPDKTQAEAQIPWSIAKATGGFTTPPAPTNPTYSSDPENLVSTGTQKGDGTIVYKLKGTSDPYTENIPQKTDVGIYTVLSHVKEGTNYTESEDVEIQNCNITEAHVAKLTINGSNKAVDYVKDQYYIFPEYATLHEEAYSTEYEMQPGHPGKVFDANKISPTKTGITPVEINKAKEEDIGTHKLGLDTKYTWVYNDNNVVVDSWVINDGGLTINEVSVVSMTISADKASAYLGEKVKYTVTISNNTSASITGGNLYLNYEKKHSSIELGPKGSGTDTVAKEIEYEVTASDFQQSTMQKFFTFELESLGYYNYASKTINLSYKDSYPNLGYQGYYDKTTHTYTATAGNIILGGDVEATDAGDYSVIIILEPGYKWYDGYVSDWRQIKWKIQKISLDVHFQMEAGQQYFSTSFGSTWNVSEQTITYSTPSEEQTVPAGEWPNVVLGGVPYGTCSYVPGMWVNNDPDVNVALPTGSVKSPNYDITITNTKLHITQAELSLSWPTKAYLYTGKVIEIQYNVSGAYEPMQPKISYTTYNKSSGTAKEFKEVGDYTVKAALVAGEAINTNYVIKSGAEPTDTFSITSDQTPKPKAVITQAFFDDPVTIRFVYDTTDYTNVPLVDAVYELTQNPSYSPNENASVYPPWHEYSKLGTIQKALFSASFKDFATFTGGATFNSLDLWFCDMTGLTSVDGFENIADRKVECMNAMFLHSCGVNCETIDISKLKPNYYIDADSMFEGCKTKYINFIPFSGSEPYQLQSTYSMFKDCENLKDIFCEGGIYAQPKQNYKVDSMFENCKELTSININQIYINSTHTIKNMFKGCFNLCGVNTTTEVKNWTDISAENSVDMFEGCEKLPNYGSSIAGQRNSQYAKSDLEGGFFTKIPEHEGRAIILGNTLTFFTEQDSSITDYYKVPVNLKNEDAPWASKAETINDISYTNNFKSWFSNVQSLHAWFKNTKVTDSVVSKLVDLNTTNIKDMSSLFYGCTETHIPDFSNLQTTSLVDISYMFSNSSLGSPQGTGTAYTCNLKTNNVKYMSNVFSGCSQLLKYNNLILSENFATSNVVDMSGMFDQCNSQSYKVQFSNSFNTSNVKDFSYMFSNCSWISKSIDQVSIMDTSNAIDMSYMFSVSNIAGEFSLENATWDLSNLQDASYMFENAPINNASFLNRVSMKNLTTANDMFHHCTRLKNISISSDLSSLRYMTNMFYNCTHLETVDLSSSSFSNSNAVDAESLFDGCDRLKSALLPKMIICNARNMFCNCKDLSNIDVSLLDMSSCSDFAQMFVGCSGLLHIYCNDGTDWSTNKPDEDHWGYYMFSGCEQLSHYTEMTGDYQLSWAKVWDGNKGFFEVKS